MSILINGVYDSAKAEGSSSAAKAPAGWWDTFAYSGQLDAGTTWDRNNPDDGKNFGRLFDDQSNGASLNQVLLTAQRPIDSSIKGYDYGFTLQGMYGSDARYTQFLHEFQNAGGNNQEQFDIVQANVQIHTPWFTEGGFDIQAGQFLSPEGAESIDPSANNFYSHSYISNFGGPSKNTGILTNLHVNPMLNLELGVDTGVNTSAGAGDNNSSLSFQGAVGLNLLGGNLVSLISTHIGPEIAKKAIANALLPSDVNPNSSLRYLSDITTTWKVTDKITLINDLSWIRDDSLNAGNPANAFGIAQYATYKLDDIYTLAARAEIFRDINGAFVSQSGNNIDYVNAEEGIPAQSSQSISGGATTYGEVSLGVNIKPAFAVSHITNLLIRPEIRYDASLNGTHPFNDVKDGSMTTSAVDVIIGF